MSKAVKIIRGAGNIKQYTSHQTLFSEYGKVAHFLGSDGKKYSNSYSSRVDSDGNRITYTAVRQPLEYLVDACTEWLKNERLEPSERKQTKWNVWNLAHHMRVVRDMEYIILLRKAARAPNGLIMSSSVINPWTDSHIKLYQITGDNGPLRLKSWKRKITLKQDEAKKILNFLDSNRVLFDGVMAKIEYLESQRQNDKDRQALVQQQHNLADAQERVAKLEATMDAQQADWDAQQAWLDSAPEHMKFKFHSHYGFKRDYASGMLEKSPKEQLIRLKTHVESYANHVKVYQAKVDQHELLHGGEEE